MHILFKGPEARFPLIPLRSSSAQIIFIINCNYPEGAAKEIFKKNFIKNKLELIEYRKFQTGLLNMHLKAKNPNRERKKTYLRAERS